MNLLHVLLVDSTRVNHALLERASSIDKSLKFQVTRSGVRHAGSLFADSEQPFDIVLFGERIKPKAAVQLTRSFRSRHGTVPIFLLTRENDAQVPRPLQLAGVDDVVNVADLNSPLFSWTFTSAIEHAVLKKKASEYDALHRRMSTMSTSLATVMHDLNNPLSVIRLIMYHLENSEITETKRDSFLKLLVANLERIDSHMSDLLLIRRQLSGEKPKRAKILSIRPSTGTA